MAEKRSVRTVAIEVFSDVKKPLHYKELTYILLEQCNLTGKTPHETVRSLIGTDSRFKRVAEGMYALSEWDEYPEARFAKDIAYDILLEFGHPLDITELGKAILDEREFVGPPKQVARNAINKDDRFAIDLESQMVSLSVWQE